MLITARDLAARGFAPRTARRLLSKLARQGHAVTVQTGGRPALAVDAATLATLAGADLDAVTECR
jgi:DNA-binding IclR family transcriptional regulator